MTRHPLKESNEKRKYFFTVSDRTTFVCKHKNAEPQNRIVYYRWLVQQQVTKIAYQLIY